MDIKAKIQETESAIRKTWDTLAQLDVQIKSLEEAKRKLESENQRLVCRLEVLHEIQAEVGRDHGESADSDLSTNG